MSDRYIVEANNINIINKHNCKKDVVGGKAYGLLMMPSSWTPTFFVISKNLYKQYVECEYITEKEQLIQTYMESINTCINNLHLENASLIIRSSGVVEGMNERGKFESFKCTCNNFKETLINLIENICKSCTVPDNEMPFVVQEYITGSITGHLSNEYRFSKEIRDWKFQSECNGEVSALTSLGVRNWRENINADNLSKYPLQANSLKKALRLLASYYTSKQLRRHIEFVYDEHRLYAVQADEDFDDGNAVDPTKYDITMTDSDSVYNFKILRYTTEEDEQKYNKIRNVAIYHSVDITTVPLYILDNLNVISSLSKDIFPQDLEDDLSLLLNRSIVIRSDITPYKKENAQLLQRSNELKNIEDVKTWLFENSKKILEKNGVFIFHNFVPAISAAFAYAKPNVRKVEIQALWGLPEGLYYNAHDRIIVDTKILDVNKLDTNKITSKDIVKKLEYKPTCILPQTTGEWMLNKIARPYNWRCSIQEDESIKQVAIESRKIAEKEQEALSIMWFIGIDETYYNTRNIPWHHEKCTIDTYTNDSYKRKYFIDEEIIIRNETDLDKLNNNTYIKCIRIQPDNDRALRDKKFIEKVGKTAKKNNIMILLEGAVLAHSFYQLNNTGANVVVANSFKEYSEELEFNKLVRDKIPQNIVAGGEKVQCAIADDNFYLYLLLNKLIEETYEAYDADDEELLYELVDIYQVCESILAFDTEHLWLIPRNNKNMYMEKEYVSFAFNHYLDSKEYQTFTKNGYFFSVALSRKKQFYEVEIKAWQEKNKTSVLCHTETVEKSLLTFLVDIASKMLNLKNITEVKNQARSIKEIIVSEILPQMQITISDFQDALNEKTNKNGAFDKKYVLLKTKFSGENIIDNDENLPLPILRGLPQKAERTIELLKTHDYSTLLLRKKIPMEYIDYFETFSNEKISVFFDRSCDMKLHFRHKNSTIYIDISQETVDKSEQLELEL